MLISLPDPYPNETIYSICARYTAIMRFPTNHGMNLFLFGRKEVKVSNDLPRNLRMIAMHYPHISIKQLLARHTALPFYAPFMSPDKLVGIVQKMVEDTRRAIVPIRDRGLHTLALPKLLRYCPICAIHQRQQHGEAYWSRLHQLPSILTCAEHDCWLELSEVETYGQHQCLTAESVIASSDQLIARNVKDEDVHLTHFARNAQQLLDGERLIYPKDDLKTRYKTILSEKGYATYAGTLRPEKLSTDFVSHYSTTVLAQFGLTIDIEESLNQLSQIIHSHNAKHPAHHLLIIGFLGYDVDTLFARDPKIKPFGDAPWPCLNPVCDHFEQPVIEQCARGFSRTRGKPLGTFICPECGHCYSRSGIDTDPSDRYRIGLLRVRGHVWERKLKQLWSQHPGQTKVIARMMKTSHQSIARYAEQLGLKESTGKAHGRRYEDIPSPSNINAYRQRWLMVLTEHPNKRVDELKAIATDVHYWLGRHDHDWLTNHIPEHRTGHKPSIDWEKLGAELEKQIIVATDAVRSSRPPIRITRTAIGREIGNQNLLRKRNLGKFPQIVPLLDKITETPEQYALRRLDMAIEQFGRDRVVKFTRTQLREAAGICKAVRTVQVEQKIEELYAAYKPP